MMRASPRLGARGPGPPGWPGLGVGGAPGGRRPPRPGFAAAATCLHRDQLLPPLRREGEGAGLWSRRSPWPIGAPHANEGARHTAAGAGRAGPSPRSPLRPARKCGCGPATPRVGPAAWVRWRVRPPAVCEGARLCGARPGAGLGGEWCPDARPRGSTSRNYPRLTTARAPLLIPAAILRGRFRYCPHFPGERRSKRSGSSPEGFSWEGAKLGFTLVGFHGLRPGRHWGKALRTEELTVPICLGLWEPEPRSKPVPTAEHPPCEEAFSDGLASAGSVRLRRHLPY